MGFNCHIAYKKDAEYLPYPEWEGQGRVWGKQLLAALPFTYNEDTYGQDIILNKEDLDTILYWCCRNPRCEDGPYYVEDLCQILGNYDYYTERGYQCIFEADW